MMASSSALNAAGLGVCNIRQIVRLDMAASDELQMRIDQVRWELKGGIGLQESTVETMENLNKDMTKDLVNHIEKIERSGAPTPLDREMLQALSARLALCDRQGMELAELRDLDKERNCERNRSRPLGANLPLGGTPRKPSKVSTLYTPEGSPPVGCNIPPPPPYRAATSSFNSGMPNPSSNSLQLSNQPLERVSSQRQQRRSREIHADHACSSSSSPSRTNASPLPSPRHINIAGHPPSPHVGSSRRPQAPADIKRNASFPKSGFPAQPQLRRDSAKSHGEYQFYSYADYSDSESDLCITPSQEARSGWPLLYRILSIDPCTDADVLLLVAKREVENLAWKHNPARVPDDPRAPARWEAINKAYDVLTHPERKREYDAGRAEPAEVLAIDLAELRIG